MNILRNSSFQGLRDDKRARDVVREDQAVIPKLAPIASETDVSRRKGNKAVRGKPIRIPSPASS